MKKKGKLVGRKSKSGLKIRPPVPSILEERVAKKLRPNRKIAISTALKSTSVRSKPKDIKEEPTAKNTVQGKLALTTASLIKAPVVKSLPNSIQSSKPAINITIDARKLLLQLVEAAAEKKQPILKPSQRRLAATLKMILK